MRRLGLFVRGLPFLSRLQFLALIIILGMEFYSKDLNPANRFLGLELWKITVPLILGAILAARLLLPVMMWNPERSQKILNGFGLIVFGVWIFQGGQWWGRLIITHLAITAAIWLDVSCWIWFISEIQLRRAAMLKQLEQYQEQMLAGRDEPAGSEEEVEV